MAVSTEASMQAQYGEHEVGGTFNAGSGPSRARIRPNDADG